MSGAQSFSSASEDVITRQSDVVPEKTPTPGSKVFFAYYDIDRTIQLIDEGDYKRIALQFPDELLHDSVPVYFALRERLGSERDAYILADTSYGSCCVDEVAASHVDADVLVHYGHACLSQTSRLPVIYVFGRRYFDVDACIDKLSSYFLSIESEAGVVPIVLIRHDVAYTHLSNELVNALKLALGDRYRVSYDPLPGHTLPASASIENEAGPSFAGERRPTERSGNKSIVWIGEESTTLTKLLLTSSGDEVVSYRPSSGEVVPQTHLTNKLLMRRYALLQKARDADVFGILVGTLGVASYLPMIKHLRERLKKARKKAYTMSVGKLNPAKLANFMEIECWVWVACSEGMIDSKEFLRPIITPYELELALEPEPTWSGRYVLDFRELLANASLEDRKLDTSDHAEDHELDPDRPTFSFVTGKYRKAKRYGADKENTSDTPTTSTDLTRRTSDTAIAKRGNSAAAHFLHERSYQGLEPRVGQDAPSILEQGRSGIARDYLDDHKEDSAA